MGRGQCSACVDRGRDLTQPLQGTGPTTVTAVPSSVPSLTVFETGLRRKKNKNTANTEAFWLPENSVQLKPHPLSHQQPLAEGGKKPEGGLTLNSDNHSSTTPLSIASIFPHLLFADFNLREEARARERDRESERCSHGAVM